MYAYAANESGDAVGAGNSEVREYAKVQEELQCLSGVGIGSKLEMTTGGKQLFKAGDVVTLLFKLWLILFAEKRSERPVEQYVAVFECVRLHPHIHLLRHDVQIQVVE
jgi:hypothetical protein